MLLPCKHDGFCFTCANILEFCPICRSDIQERIQIETVNSLTTTVDDDKEEEELDEPVEIDDSNIKVSELHNNTMMT